MVVVVVVAAVVVEARVQARARRDAMRFDEEPARANSKLRKTTATSDYLPHSHAKIAWRVNVPPSHENQERKGRKAGMDGAVVPTTGAESKSKSCEALTSVLPNEARSQHCTSWHDPLHKTRAAASGLTQVGARQVAHGAEVRHPLPTPPDTTSDDDINRVSYPA